MYMRAAIYCRISDDQENREVDLDIQESACRVRADAENWKIVGVYTDDDRSAPSTSREIRPGYERLLTAARSHEFDMVLSYSRSRLIRDPQDNESWLALADAGQVGGCFLAGPGTDWATPEGRSAARTRTAWEADAADWNARIISEFRANGGTVSGSFEGVPVLILTTIGAKTGRRHTLPLMYLRDDNRLIIFASKAGADTNPDWYHNLKANPFVTVEVGTEEFPAVAEEVVGLERDELYTEQVKRYSSFGDYEHATSRVIPVVALIRR